MSGLGSGEWMPTTFHAVDARTQLCSSIFQFWMPLEWEGEGRGMGQDGWVGIWGVDANNFGSSCCGRSRSRLSFNFGGPWDGRERAGGWGRMGGLGSGEWMPTTLDPVAADAAVLVYLSILEAPGMGGRGEGEREGWAGWDLGSGCRQLS